MDFRQFDDQASSSQQSDGNSTSFLFGLMDFFICQTCFHKILMLFTTFKFFLLCQLHPVSKQMEEAETESEEEEEEKDSESGQETEYSSCEENIERDEVKMVMGKLGLFCSSESDDDEELNESYGSEEISELFEDQEPSLKEVKLAFDVFDENKDGFIDAKELQRVLCVLGFKEATEIDNCQNMINKFDENQDGRIDFNEFVKLMENRFC